MKTIELTEEQFMDFASKIFELSFHGEGYGPLKAQPFYVQSDWISAAIDAVDGYNSVVENVDFPGISVMENCCLICKHCNIYRPACNLRGDDVSLDCVCSKFELVDLEDEDYYE